MSFSITYITCPNTELAKNIASTLVHEKLVACANIFPKIHSIYEWEGKVCEENEVVLLVKAPTSQFNAIEDRVKDLHEYDCPCIVNFEMNAGSQEFLEWISKQTRKA